MEPKKVLATIKVAGQIASCIGATKILASALVAGYQWYNTPEEDQDGNNEEEKEEGQDDG